VVKPNEPNPFNKGETGSIKQEDTTSDENKVKDALMGLRASGVVYSDDGSVRAVMLGQLKLERGMVVPPVLPDQDVHLRVNSLSESTIELVWIEKRRTWPCHRARHSAHRSAPDRALLPAIRHDGRAPPPPKAGQPAMPIGRQAAPLLTQPPPPPTMEAQRAIPDRRHRVDCRDSAACGTCRQGSSSRQLADEPVPQQAAAHPATARSAQMKPSRQRCAGFSAAELLVAMAIGAVIIGAAAVAYGTIARAQPRVSSSAVITLDSTRLQNSTI